MGLLLFNQYILECLIVFDDLVCRAQLGIDVCAWGIFHYQIKAHLFDSIHHCHEPLLSLVIYELSTSLQWH